MLRGRNYFCFFIVFILIFSGACKKSNNTAPSDTSVSYSQSIAPLFALHCTTSGCHAESNLYNFPLQTYDEVINYANVIPHDTAQSRLYQVLSNNFMPSGDSLTLEQKQLVYNWILQGAENN